MRKANVVIIIISVLVALWAFAMLLPSDPVSLEQARQSNARVFCAFDRQWVEFQNANATWGAQMLDERGHPVPCDSKEKAQ